MADVMKVVGAALGQFRVHCRCGHNGWTALDPGEVECSACGATSDAAALLAAAGLAGGDVVWFAG